MHGGAALPLARQVEAAQWMVAQRHGAVAPLHIGTRALEHGRQPLGLGMELGLGLRVQRAPGATGLKQLTITHNFRELGARSKGQVVDNKKGGADNKLGY